VVCPAKLVPAAWWYAYRQISKTPMNHVEDPVSTIQTQRRRSSRRAVSEPAVIRIGFKDRMGNSRHITADLVDWSEAGLSLTLVAPIEIGTIIQLRGRLAGEGSDISCPATIAWCTEDKGGRFRVGLEFTERQSDLPKA